MSLFCCEKGVFSMESEERKEVVGLLVNKYGYDPESDFIKQSDFTVLENQIYKEEGYYDDYYERR